MSLRVRPGLLSLRSHLITLVGLTTVLMLGMAAYAITRTASDYKASTSNRLTETARTLARAVESDLNGKFTLLRTLAATTKGDVQSTQMLLEMIAPEMGKVIIYTPDQMPEPQLGLNGDAAQVLAASHEPALTNLLSDSEKGTHRVAMGMVQSGPAPRVLALLTSPERFLNIAAQSGTTEASLLVAITDGSGRIVARSRDSGRFVGRPVPDWGKLQALGAPRGLFEAKTAEGGTVIFAFQKLSNTPGWVVVTGEPLSNFNARWQEPLIRMAGGAVIALLVALAVTAVVARQVLRPVQALARSAQAVVEEEAARDGGLDPGLHPASGGAEAVSPSLLTNVNFRIREFESLRESIEAAQSALKRRALAEHAAAEALKSSERRYRTLAEAGTLVLWRGRPDGPLSALTGWETLTGDTEDLALGLGWLQRVHPDDLVHLKTAMSKVAQGARQFDSEFRLQVRDRRWLWVRARGATVTDEQDQILEWVGVLEDVDERHRAQARVVHMAHHDALTGLPNRVEFRRCLDAALKRAGRGETSAVLYVDLDRFKEVNDTLGHPVGDALLLAVTERLSGLVRDTDTVARLGGDEFAIVQTQVADASDASGLAERVVEVIGAPYALSGHQVTIGASIGIALITKGVSDEPDALLKRADMALYRAKQQGRGRFCFFEQEMDARAQSRRQLELLLRQAYKEGEFELAYRPYVSCDDNRVIGVEVCLHWHHPEEGLVAFDHYESLADEIGLGGALVEWAIERACQDATGWPTHTRLAVVAGPAAITRPGFAEFVGDVLARTGLDPHRLELRVAERDLIQQAERVFLTLTKLKAQGVQIVISSFGSAQSALGFLRSFGVDKVRLDKHFISDLARQPEHVGRIHSMVELCRKFGVTLAADGVNSELQLEMVRQEGCAEVQGDVTGPLLWRNEVAAIL